MRTFLRKPIILRYPGCSKEVNSGGMGCDTPCGPKEGRWGKKIAISLWIAGVKGRNLVPEVIENHVASTKALSPKELVNMWSNWAISKAISHAHPFFHCPFFDSMVWVWSVLSWERAKFRLWFIILCRYIGWRANARYALHSSVYIFKSGRTWYSHKGRLT